MTHDRGSSHRDPAMGSSVEQRTIVICANTAWNLGNFRAPIITSLRADGHRVIAAAARDGTERRLTALGAEFRPLPIQSSSRNPVDDLRLFLGLLRLLRKSISLPTPRKPRRPAP